LRVQAAASWGEVAGLEGQEVAQDSGALAASGQDPAELDGVHVDVITATA
jgi:hypothetical protein